jgi:PPOX class probable F420-dependent enzyme
MQLERAHEFLRQHHRAVLATRHPSGRLQLSPVLIAVDDQGRGLVSTRETARKTRNVLQDPRVTLCVMTDAFFGDWLQIEGEAEIVDLPAAMDLLVDYYRRISGEHPDWDAYRASMADERRVVLRISIDRVGPDAHG